MSGQRERTVGLSVLVEAGGVRERRERTIEHSVLVPHDLAERSEAGA